MNILIVFCHPSRNSYTYDVLTQLTQEIERTKWKLDISNLYAMNFRSDMTEEEYNREGPANTALSIPDDVVEEHKKIECADCIIFLYPVWWSDCPAKLKGWFDRVYTAGYAYKQTDAVPGMKLIDYGLVLCTAGHPNHFLAETGLAQSMQTVMLDDRLGKRFRRKEMIILGGTLALDKVKQQHTELIKNVINKILAYCS